MMYVHISMSKCMSKGLIPRDVIGREYVQGVHPRMHVKRNMSAGISGAIFKALCPRDVSKFL